ncbi:MAG: hypothetical protein QE271_06760 [Bacteriovoracaceae bacterium]|nr:hypothetical protein [Bacteriovoracaceae bacterium]
MAGRKNESFLSITEILGFLTPAKIERAFDSIKIVLKGADGQDKQIRFLVTEDEFEPILSEKSLIGSMVKGSMLWIPDAPKARSGYSSFMLSDADGVAVRPDDGQSSANELDLNKQPQTDKEFATNETTHQEVHERVDGDNPAPALSSTDFLLKNRTQKKKVNEKNLKAFKSGKKENTSFIINKKTQ